MTADDIKAWLTSYYANNDPTNGVSGASMAAACASSIRSVIGQHCGKPPPLTWRQWEILSLYFPLRFSQETIALDHLGVSVSTVQRDFRDALESIAKRWT